MVSMKLIDVLRENPMRRRKEFKPDIHGRISREIGWKRSNGDGRVVQHKFYLGNDRDKAELANARLERLWRLIEADHAIDLNGDANSDRPLWNDVTLEIGRAIARGSTKFTVDLDARFDGEVASSYTRRVRYLADTFSSVIKVIPGDEDVFQKGRQDELEFADRMEAIARKIRARVDGDLTQKYGPTLHEAFDAYVAWLKKECAVAPASNGDEPKLSPWGYAQLKNVNRLKERHADMPLSALNQAACEDMIRFWRLQPKVKGKDTAIAPKTAQHHIKQLKRFLNWLHRSQDFAWRRPEDFDLIETRVEVPAHERARRLSPLQVATFDVDELRLLNEYATPLERALLLLGLNCGFNKAEIGTLTVGEIVLRQRHPYENKLAFESSEKDSFIKRVRHRTACTANFFCGRRLSRRLSGLLRIVENRPGFLLMKQAKSSHLAPTACCS